MTLTFIKRIPAPDTPLPHFVLSLTAEERTRSRHLFQADSGETIALNLPRGTTLRDGDWLESSEGKQIVIRAKSEPVMTVTANTALNLLQAAYHLGNRHVALQITDAYLRLSPDSVLKDLLEHRGLTVVDETAPFQPESGAYGHTH